MIPIYYKSSEGEIVNLIETPYRMLTETDLLNSEWEPTTVGENFPRISRLDKKLVSPKFKIRVTGSTKTEMLNNLEHIESVFDRDCFLNQMGRLYIGEFYRECFITGITHGKVFEKTHTVAEYVATSNNSYWVNDKTLTFSGFGALVGEMADKVLMSANYNNATMVVTPLANHKEHITYTPPQLTSPDRYYWFKLDFGSVMDIESISGLKLKRGAPPISLNVETSDGEREDDSRTISATVRQETDPIIIDDFTTITVDSYGESGWGSTSLKMYGYVGSSKTYEVIVESTQTDLLGQPIDVSEYDYVTFFVGYSSGTTSVNYTVNEEQWTTVETITVPIGTSEAEVELSDLTCRYVRLKGNYLGTGFDEDLSVVSGEEVGTRDITDTGYSTENLSMNVNREAHIVGFTLLDPSENGYVTFDKNDIVLKRIQCEFVRAGTIKVQGLNNGTWSDIATLTDNFDTSYDTHYDRLRVVIPTQNVQAVSQNFRIMVESDASIANDSYAPSDAIIKIKGPWANPYIVINDISYGAELELLENHTLVIDTKKKTVRDYSDTDTYENVYANRLENTFEQIESGVNEVDWSGDAEEIQITLEQARSIPKWN